MIGLYLTPKKKMFSLGKTRFCWRTMRSPYISVPSAEYSGCPGAKFCTGTNKCCAIDINRTMLIHTTRGPEPFLEESPAAAKTWMQPDQVHERILLNAFLVLKKCKLLLFKLALKKNPKPQSLTMSSTSVKPWVFIYTSSAYQPNMNCVWNSVLARMLIESSAQLPPSWT